MAVKTNFSSNELEQILSGYDSGVFRYFNPIAKGTVQTNLLLGTSNGRFIFRYYENRSYESVLFESNLIGYLRRKKYPCPAPIRNRHGKFVGIHNNKPYIIFEFVEGHHIEYPTNEQKKRLIRQAAELHNITKHYRSTHKMHRWNYGVDFCRQLARQKAEQLDTADSYRKLMWLEAELSTLELPKSLPKGICHCDFHFSNVLFKGNEFRALIDFDDANYTYLLIDLVGLVESSAWRHDEDEVLNLTKARIVVSEYQNYRHLNNSEKKHLFDVHKLCILIDTVWYFARDNSDNFHEKRKIDFLNALGRNSFSQALFV